LDGEEFEAAFDFIEERLTDLAWRSALEKRR
jgi:hypothetical protein